MTIHVSFATSYNKPHLQAFEIANVNIYTQKIAHMQIEDIN